MYTKMVITSVGVTLLLCAACKKNNGVPIPIPVKPGSTVVIDSISPSTGPGNTKVTIHGTGFGAVGTADIVTFNGDTAVLQYVSPDSIVATVRIGTGSGPVKVTSNGDSATGPTFTYILTAMVSTFAGNGIYSFRDGPGDSAEFNSPKGLAIDGEGNLYVADYGNFRIRKITPDGMVSTIVGDGSGTNIYYPVGVAVDASGNVFFTAGQGYIATNYVYMYSTQDIQSTIAYSGKSILDGDHLRLAAPGQCVAPPGGGLLVADPVSNQIDLIAYSLPGAPAAVESGGDSTNISIYNQPQDVAVDPTGSYYVTDPGHAAIDKAVGISAKIFAGNGLQGYTDGTGTGAQFNYPEGITTDSKGNVYVTDWGNNNIRMITPAGVVTTLAGPYVSIADASAGFMDGPAATAAFAHPTGIAVDAKGNVYVADTYNCRIRKISIQ